MAKIVILGPAYPLRGGGMSTFNERLAREFIKKGHQVIIYTFSLQYPSILFPGKTQYSDDQPPVDLHIKVKVNSINPFNWIRIGTELKKERPDFLVIRYWIPFMALCLGTIASMTRKNRHTRIVGIIDNAIPHEKRPFDTNLTRFFLNRMDKCITMTKKVEKDLIKLKTPPEKLARCMHPLYDNYGEAIDKVEARKALNINNKDHLILFFGFIRDYKGLDLLIKAMANENVRKEDVKLLVAGEFYTKPQPYEDLVQSLHLKESIIWHNHFIANDLIRVYFSAADLVVQPYKQATQSGVTQIAYYFETPMVVTNVGGLPEMVTHQKAGYVVQPHENDIAAAIVDYFKNNRKQYFRKGIKEEKKRFSWETITQLIMS